MGSEFPYQGLNLCPLPWKCRGLIARPPGKSLFLTFLPQFFSWKPHCFPFLLSSSSPLGDGLARSPPLCFSAGAQLTCPLELASRGVGTPGSRAGRGWVTAALGPLWLCPWSSWWLATFFTSRSLNVPLLLGDLLYYLSCQAGT